MKPNLKYFFFAIQTYQKLKNPSCGGGGDGRRSTDGDGDMTMLSATNFTLVFQSIFEANYNNNTNTNKNSNLPLPLLTSPPHVSGLWQRGEALDTKIECPKVVPTVTGSTSQVAVLKDREKVRTENKVMTCMLCSE
ncbi:single-stranded nucleic acid binding R3H protein [Striga asiatica]|uniref:Single-stranded nucleic acid binding R3H protein n=1 Tax=Striga asiatica TaxID=4170 RepID=A0A5A7PXZ2_STRAF|nr:single-stranded nucleic acid binding R3H protein [Striga asiatica]